MAQIQIDHYSDVLCVWAYFSEPRLAELSMNFGDQVSFTYHFVAVFGDVPGKIASVWGAKGGYEGFAAHTLQSAEKFPELHLSAKIWRETRPPSSLSVHLYLKAIAICEKEGHCPVGAYAMAISKMREAFFAEGRNIASSDVQQVVGAAVGASARAVIPYLQDGRAHAALSADHKTAETLGISGSPTLVFNQGRQRLFGNVGYRIIEANVQELLRDPKPDTASWC